MSDGLVEVCHVYLCGHHEVEFAPLNKPEYVFVLGGCLNCGLETIVDGDNSEHPTLEALTEHLSKVSQEIETNIDWWEAHQYSKNINPPPLRDRETITVLLDHEELAGEHFHLNRIQVLLKHMHRFSQSASHRPFFDFCRQQANFYLDIAQRNSERLASFVDPMRERLEWAIPGRLPNPEYDYEGGFGVEELRLLRLAGRDGEDILSQPFHLRLLEEAEGLVGSMRAIAPRL